MRIYMAGAMFTEADKQYNLRLADQLRSHGFEVYCPNESEPINDKTRTDVTGKMIYDFDIRELEATNVVLLQVVEDSGSNWEAGYMDALSNTSIRNGGTASWAWQPTSGCKASRISKRASITNPATSTNSSWADCRDRSAFTGLRTTRSPA